MGIVDVFRRKPKNLDEFVEVAKKRHWEEIAVTMRVVSGKKKGVAVLRSGGHVEHWLDFAGMNSRGRGIVYREKLFDRDDGGFSDVEGRRSARAEHSRLADGKARELKTKLPSVFVRVIK
ncbi:hypothetical protein A2116_01600 [Candidatus Jorgensenbacteria bacterium GWA1_49_17]|uniref:Uncharacterized protein n=2 Tax=Candidatus Joergenseniibacteriota TaxID=1752739 RepID=A0A1F6BPT7_9BACT|nr:MAG: hypothetical protein A2127_01935 [Candidatus Jorgensenbacteria bacterium GWC1_48_12]OGG40362.1 MAG: hypothetical protein A2116_01600 [Candidatus Jorgensenbacteria bacterium GWA1_49_17]